MSPWPKLGKAYYNTKLCCFSSFFSNDEEPQAPSRVSASFNKVNLRNIMKNYLKKSSV